MTSNINSPMPIEIDHVVKSFGAVRAVDGVTLSVARGELFGLIGHNGAGKSTLFKLMLGLIPATSGEVRIHGVSTAHAGFRQLRRRIGYLPESFVTYDNLSGLEVMQLFADLKGAPRSSCLALLSTVGLAAVAKRRVRTYSKGMRQRLGFAQVLLGDPDLIFLDEPTNGLDPEGIHDFYAILRNAQDRGVTVIITSHILAEIQSRVDRLAILNGGKIAAQGTLGELRAQMVLPSVIQLRLREGTSLSPPLSRIVAALAPWPDSAPREEHGSVLISCSAAQKLAVLGALSVCGDAIQELAVHEPTLEDLFLGYGGNHVRTH